MKYRNLENLSSGQFKRLTGVSRNTFSRMALIVNQEKKVSKKYKGGRYPKLNTEDTVLMMLEYLRTCLKSFQEIKSVVEAGSI